MGLIVLEFMAIPAADTIAAILKIENVSVTRKEQSWEV